MAKDQVTRPTSGPFERCVWRTPDGTRHIAVVSTLDGAVGAIALTGREGAADEALSIANAERIVRDANACERLVRELRALVARCDTSELADGSSIDTSHAHAAIALVEARTGGEAAEDRDALEAQAAEAGCTVAQLTCRHEWNQSAGEADESGGRIYCLSCGLDGDA